MIFPRLTRRGDRPAPAVLALRALGLGDLLTAAPALRALSRHFAAQPLLLATGAHLEGLARRIVPRIQVVETQGLDRPVECGNPVTVAVDLHGSGPQSHRRLLATRPECLLAYRNPEVWTAPDAPTWDADEHEVTRWIRLLASAEIPATIEDLRLARPGHILPDPNLTVIHPGAASPSRRWPAKRWASVAAYEIGAGRGVVLTGSASERHLASLIAELAQLPPEANLAGQTDIENLFGLVAGAGFLYSADTGPAHLATALGTPSVTLFGPTPPSQWGPLLDTDIHTVLWHGAPGDPHGSVLDPSLAAIGAGEVVIAAAGVRQEVAL